MVYWAESVEGSNHVKPIKQGNQTPAYAQSFLANDIASRLSSKAMLRVRLLRWLEYKAGRRQSYKDPSHLVRVIAMACEDFPHLTADDLSRSVDRSIGQGYQGLVIHPKTEVQWKRQHKRQPHSWRERWGGAPGSKMEPTTPPPPPGVSTVPVLAESPEWLSCRPRLVLLVGCRWSLRGCSIASRRSSKVARLGRSTFWAGRRRQDVCRAGPGRCRAGCLLVAGIATRCVACVHPRRSLGRFGMVRRGRLLARMSG